MKTSIVGVGRLDLCLWGLRVLGWVLAQAVSKVEESTAGYVKWMIETLDKMFLTVGRTCLYLIIALIFWFFFGFWFTGVCHRETVISRSNFGFFDFVLGSFWSANGLPDAESDRQANVAKAD